MALNAIMFATLRLQIAPLVPLGFVRDGSRISPDAPASLILITIAH